MNEQQATSHTSKGNSVPCQVPAWVVHTHTHTHREAQAKEQPQSGCAALPNSAGPLCEFRLPKLGKQTGTSLGNCVIKQGRWNLCPAQCISSPPRTALRHRDHALTAKPNQRGNTKKALLLSALHYYTNIFLETDKKKLKMIFADRHSNCLCENDYVNHQKRMRALRLPAKIKLQRQARYNPCFG